MGTLEENRKQWQQYEWTEAGDEWSDAWGSAVCEWYGTILPRLHQWVPTETMVEIAPGFGRWTQYLKDLARHLVVVDLTEKCITVCRERFAAASNISYFVNDGQSLRAAGDMSVDLIFSFDSLVHVEADVIEAYLHEFARTLSPNGVAFIHHSNVGVYRRRLAVGRRLNTAAEVHWRLSRLTKKMSWSNRNWRAESMTAMRFEALSQKAGLQCRSQEIIPWGTSLLSDCISVVTRPRSRWARPNVVFTNRDFAREIRHVAALEPLYHR
jgi:ubiquinone/menaquinone biosynthesis C-methylase UbiE